VPASHEATFEYGFIPSEVFAFRPFGLVINMNYRNAVRFPLSLCLIFRK
jgi:hypothetical protein